MKGEWTVCKRVSAFQSRWDFGLVTRWVVHWGEQWDSYWVPERDWQTELS